MDVLEANLYHLLPPAPTDERPRAISSHFDRIERSDALEKLKTDEEELEGIKELDPAAEVENHVLELLTGISAHFYT